MTVRCCRTYEEVHEGDVGKIIKLDRDGLHDLNLQVEWQRKGGTYWVRYIHVELLSMPNAALSGDKHSSANTPSIIKVSQPKPCYFE
jgi:E3 ubiquitin-protein ligase HERC2